MKAYGTGMIVAACVMCMCQAFFYNPHFDTWIAACLIAGAVLCAGACDD